MREIEVLERWKNRLELLRDALFVVSIAATIIFFLSPKLQRAIEANITGKAALFHAGTYYTKHEIWRTVDGKPDRHFYHLLWDNKAKFAEKDFHQLVGKTLIGDPQDPTPGRELPPSGTSMSEFEFSEQPVMTALESNACYRVKNTYAKHLEPCKAEGCKHPFRKISFWVEAVKVTCF